MARPFSPAELERMRNIVAAIVPHGVSINANSINEGWKASLVICGSTSCQAYELLPPIDHRKIVAIAEQWMDGRYEPAVNAEHLAQVVKRVTTLAELLAWSRTSRPNQRVAYFEGSVVHFRHNAPIKMRKLETVADRRTAKTRKWAKKSGELEKIRETLELLDAVEKLRQSGRIQVFQQRKPDGTGAVYYAVRR